MECTYMITADSRPRLLMRIAQVFDQQLLSLRELRLSVVDGVTTVYIHVDATPDIAHRIKAKLYSHNDIHEVHLVSENASGNEKTSPRNRNP